MTKNLRKRHLQCWSMLMVLLPAGIISARLATPQPVTGILLQPAAVAAYPTLLKKVETKNYAVSIRMNSDRHFQLEWINKTVLNFPTAVVYAMPAGGGSNISNGVLLGRIEAMGTYRFPVPSGNTAFNPPGRLLLFDFIHQQVLDTIHF